MEEYRSNSHKLRDGAVEPVVPERKLDSVVSGQAVVQKKTGFSKIASSIIAEDARNVGAYIVTDVLIPAIKKSLDDIVSNGIHMLLYGRAAESRSGSLASKISYSGFYQKSYNDRERQVDTSAFDYDNIIFSNRGDAEAVLSSLDDIIDSYGVVSVGDLYELSDIAAPSYTVNKYGWTNIRSAEVIRCRDGYMLKMPRATVLK